ncbi:hypothetical protein [Sinorhizobium fredii]|uniref:hypothetical protein n=1 Tax=Rhizobium fredii TaxID=380 RepID=UPI0004AEEA5D|nr:hypothetical protein [Sinorhizobium fredii]
MAQHDQVIDNGPGLAVRTDFNAALAALFSSSSGAVEPAVKVAGQLWFNTSTGKLTMRNAGNTAWQPLADEMSGTVNVSTPPATFTGTTADTATSILRVRDNAGSTGADGNAVFAINRQNSNTEAMIFGNDGNSAGLIGGNNVPLRFGKWVSGVFTEYLNMNTSGAFVLSGGLTIDPPSGVQGLHLAQADAHSGRLFFSSAAHVWSVLAWDTDGTLQFNSGGVYGTSTGSARVRMYENGDLRTGGATYSTLLGITAAPLTTGSPLRVAYQGRTAAGGGQADIVTYTDAGVEDARFFLTNSTLTVKSVGSTPVTHGFLMEDHNGQNRIFLYRNATWGFLLEARDSAGASEGYIGLEHDGDLVTNNGEGTYPVIHTGNLDLTCYTGSIADATTVFPVGSIIVASTGAGVTRNSAVIPCLYTPNSNQYIKQGLSGAGTALSGTWRARGLASGDNTTILQRTA